MAISPIALFANLFSKTENKGAKPKQTKSEVGISSSDTNLRSIYGKDGSKFYPNPIIPKDASSKQINRTAQSAQIRKIKEAPSHGSLAFEKFISAKQRVSLKEYKNIKEKHPEVIEEARSFVENEKKCNMPLKQCPKDTAKFALDLKKYFDEEYGKGNYTIVSIGTSPAIITESMAATDSDVIFLPMSGLHSAYYNCVRDINAFSKYRPRAKVVCEHIKDVLNHSKRHFKNKSKIILLDYKAGGNTLNFAQDAFVKYCNISPHKVEVVDIKEVAEKFYCENSSLCKNIKRDMFSGCVANYANTPHYDVDMSVKELKKTYFSDALKPIMEYEKFVYETKLKEYSCPLGRAYQLLVLDEMDKMGGIG